MKELETLQSAVQDPQLLNLTAINFDNIPKPLLDTPSWILWQPQYNRQNGKISKTPKGGQNWQTKYAAFRNVLEDYKIAQPNFPTGLGFVFNYDHAFVCIDIDAKTIDNTTLIKTLNSYTEISPSGEGVHVWVQLFTIEDKQKLKEYFGTKKFNKTYKRDLFISSGYVTITGDIDDISSLDIPDIRVISLDDLIEILKPYFTKIVPLEAHQRDAQQTKDLLYKQRQRQITSKRLNTDQVKLLLRKIDVKTLTANIFEKLSHPTELAILDPDETEEARDPWLIICQAVHHNFNGDPTGLILLQDWSKHGNKYDKQDTISVYESFSNDPKYLNQRKPITINSLIALVKAQKPDFADVSGKGVPLATLQNLKSFFEFYKILASYNIISNEVTITFPTSIMKTLGENSKTVYDSDKATRIVASELLKLGFSPRTFLSLKDSVVDYAKLDSYNPIETYFKETHKNYDKEATPLDDLMETLTLEPSLDPPHCQQAIRIFIKKWLTQVVAAATTSVTHSTRIFNNLLIFIGDQGIGKTKWVASLFPNAIQQYCVGSGNLQVNQFRTDNVKQAIELQRTLICNINEIDLLFQEKTYSKFKQLLDETTSSMVLPYGRAATTMVRRTVFIGSTNKRYFLVDYTGNRRITLIPVLSMNDQHNIDLEQLWAHAYHWFTTEKCWWLDSANEEDRRAIELQHKLNDASMAVSELSIMEDFDLYFDIHAREHEYQKIVFKNVRDAIPNFSNLKLNSKAFREAKYAFALWLKQTEFGKIMPKANNIRAAQYYKVPPFKVNKQIASFREAAKNAKDTEEIPKN